MSGVIAAQNGDGGWGYSGGGSWTEPTVYALLAHAAAGAGSESALRGLKWLAGAQRPDGGWPPRPSVDQSTWVTALALLVMADGRYSPQIDRGVRWLLDQRGRESTLVVRLRAALLGVRSDSDTSLRGWPWYPGAAAWVAPTALTILALRKVARHHPSKEVLERIYMGEQYLLSRMCADGGWNHGSSRALGYEAGSYPETTGLVLLALRGCPTQRLAKSFAAAERHLRSCGSAEGLSWLRLGLLAHSRPYDGPSRPAVCRNVVDASLSIVADAAGKGRNVFME